MAVDYRPNADDVATVLKGYTTGKWGGSEAGGTFSEATTPTRDDVEAIITATIPLVAARLGSTPPAGLLPAAKSVAALRAAMGVVRGYMRQSDGNERDLYEILRDEYRDALTDYDLGAKGNDSSSAAGGSRIGNIGVRTVYTA